MKKIRWIVILLILTIVSVCGCRRKVEKQEQPAIQKATEDECKERSEYWTPVYKDGEFVIIDLNNEVIAKIDDQDVYGAEFNFQKSEAAKVYNDEALFGYVNKKGTMIVPCEYNEWGYLPDLENHHQDADVPWLPDWFDGLLAVERDGKLQYINADGEIVDTGTEVYDYRQSGEFGKIFDGLAAVSRDLKLGFVNHEREEIVPCVYSDYFSESDAPEGCLWVDRDGKWGCINAEGREVVPCIYENFRGFSGGFAAVQKDEKWGYINESGEEVIPFIFENARDFSEGLAAVELDEKWGYINTQGKERVPFLWDYAHEFSEGLAKVTQGITGGYIDEHGYIVLPFDYNGSNFMDEEAKFQDGIVGVCLLSNGKMGFVNRYGEEVVSCTYDCYFHSTEFINGIAVLAKDDFKGCINREEEIVIPFVYDGIWHNEEAGLVFVSKDELHGCYDEQGKELVPLEYKELRYETEQERIVGKKEDCIDVYNKSGERLFTWNGVLKDYFGEKQEYIRVCDENGLYGVLDWDGNVIIEPQYYNYHEYIKK